VVHRSSVALFVCASLFALQSQTLAFHTHAVAEHTDGTHHHGPAMHHHDEFDRLAHISGSEAPVGRILTVAVPSAIATASAFVVADATEALTVPTLHPLGEALDVDVRSHDPPAVFEHSLRGPPFPHFLLITRSA
jgi:hypothetical protein